VVAGLLGDRVAKGDHGGAQAGYQGARGVAAKFPGVTSHDTRQTLRDTVRGDVVELVKGHVGDVTVSNETMRLPAELPPKGAADAAGGDGPGGDNPAAPVTMEVAGGAVPPPGQRRLRAAEAAAAQPPRAGL